MKSTSTGTSTPPRLLTVPEAAELLRLAPKSLYQLVSRRAIPYRKAGRRLLFLESELMEWTVPEGSRRKGRNPQGHTGNDTVGIR